MIDSPPKSPVASDRVLERARRMMKSEIVSGRPDPEGLLDLFRVVAPGEDLGDPRFVSWLYDENPGGKTIELVTRNKELVTGHIALVPLRYKTPNGATTGSMAVNAITHPDYRGRGIFIILHDIGFKQAASENVPFTFGYANLNSEKGCLRHLGYRELARIPLWLLPLNLPRIMASHAAKRSWLWRAAGLLAGPPARLWRAARRPFGANEIAVERIREFGTEFDRFWESVSDAADNILVRDRAFLDWRFVRAPTRRYDLFAARSDGRLLGYLAGRTAVVEGLRWALVMDLLTEKSGPGRAAASRLVAAYRRHIAKDGVDLMAALMFKHAPAAAALRRNGYLPCPPSLLPREFPALLHWNMPDTPPPGLFDPASWFITLADSDAM